MCFGIMDRSAFVRGLLSDFDTVTFAIFEGTCDTVSLLFFLDVALALTLPLILDSKVSPSPSIFNFGAIIKEK